ERGEFLSIMVNEEDHLRLQVLMSGLNLREAWQRVNTLDDEMEERMDYAFSHIYGYLTACPTNLGTGIRCSVMVHLPALVISQRIKKVLSAVTQIGLTVRGLAGEGSEIAGNLFQISNQWTLGSSEAETTDKLEQILEQIVENERKTQQELWAENRIALEDKVWRAYGILSHSRVVNSREALELLSNLRLGLNLGLINGIPYSAVNDVIIQCRPAHLQKRAGQKLSALERDAIRGEFLRNWIRRQTP
ncbi:MAG: ATP--guanido phosphotransferase, partial [bacterium]